MAKLGTSAVNGALTVSGKAKILKELEANSISSLSNINANVGSARQSRIGYNIDFVDASSSNAVSSSSISNTW